METISKIFSKLAEWMNSFVKYFGMDGLLHIAVSFALVTILDIVFPLWIAVVITAILGLVKELVYDLYLGKGECSKKDLLADLIGIILGCI